MSNAFNVFVVMQIFNLINVRKINDEVNVFEGILTDNINYIIVWLICVGGQAIIIEFSGTTFKVAAGGLPW